MGSIHIRPHKKSNETLRNKMYDNLLLIFSSPAATSAIAEMIFNHDNLGENSREMNDAKRRYYSEIIFTGHMC